MTECSDELGHSRADTAAISLYRSLGFEPFGIERDFLFVGGEYHDECRMVWRAAGTG